MAQPNTDPDMVTDTVRLYPEHGNGCGDGFLWQNNADSAGADVSRPGVENDRHRSRKRQPDAHVGATAWRYPSPP
jgi:hypothetical protein